MQKEMGLPFAVLCSVPFVMVLSNSMLIPVLPNIQQALDISLFQASLVITAFSVPAGLAIPFGGLGSDHFGRKKIIVPALFLFGLGGLVAGLAPLLMRDPFLMMIGGRLLQGIGGGGLYQVALALAGDLYQGKARSRVMGILEASNGLGKVTSPIIGAAAALWFWYAPFFVYPILSWLAAAGVWWWVKEPEKPAALSRLETYRRELGRIFRHAGVSLSIAYAVGAAALFMLFGVLSWYSDVLESDHQISGFPKGFILAVPVLVMAVTSWFAGTSLQRRLSRWMKSIALVGLAMIGIGLIGLEWVGGVMGRTAVISLVGLGNGLALPAINTLITSSADRRQRGMVTALYGTVRFFGTAFGPPAFGLLTGVGTALAFYASAAVMLAVGVLAMLWLNPSRLMGEKAGHPEDTRKAG